MAKLKNTSLGTMLPEKVDNVSPDSGGNIALSAVRYVSQPLSDAQKSQARTNIGAVLTNAPGYGAWQCSDTYEGQQVYIVWDSGGWIPAVLANDGSTAVITGIGMAKGDLTSTSLSWDGSDAAGDFSATRSTNSTGFSAWRANPPQIWDPFAQSYITPSDPDFGDVWGGGSDEWYTSDYYVEGSPMGPAAFGNSDPNATSLSATLTIISSDYEQSTAASVTWTRERLRGYVYAGDGTRTIAENAMLESHVGNTSNPHNVTKSQVGLGSVDNVGFRHSAGAFQSAVQYYSGDFCIYSNALYKFTASHKGAWNASHATKICDLAAGMFSYAMAAATSSTSGTTQTVTLADCTVGSATQGSGVTMVTLAYPTAVSGKSRDFLLALTCGSSPPSLTFPSGTTTLVESGVVLQPEEGVNLYSFTEVSSNSFVVCRKLVAATS